MNAILVQSAGSSLRMLLTPGLRHRFIAGMVFSYRELFMQNHLEPLLVPGF
jgi:hypothetical protein